VQTTTPAGTAQEARSISGSPGADLLHLSRRLLRERHERETSGPQVNITISYFNAPAGGSCVARRIDLYSINTDNRLYLTSRYPGGFQQLGLDQWPRPAG